MLITRKKITKIPAYKFNLNRLLPAATVTVTLHTHYIMDFLLIFIYCELEEPKIS